MNELQKQEFLQGNVIVKLKDVEDVVEFVKYCILNNIKYDKKLNEPAKYVKQNTVYFAVNSRDSGQVQIIRENHIPYTDFRYFEHIPFDPKPDNSVNKLMSWI